MLYEVITPLGTSSQTDQQQRKAFPSMRRKFSPTILTFNLWMLSIKRHPQSPNINNNHSINNNRITSYNVCYTKLLRWSRAGERWASSAERVLDSGYWKRKSMAI